MPFFGFSLRLLPLSLLRVKRPWCIYLFQVRDVYLYICICNWGCRFHDFSFCLFYVRGDWALFSPPPTAPHTVCSKYSCVEVFYFILQWRERGGMCGGTMYSYYRSQLVCPPPSPFSHYSQLLPFTVGVSPPSHFPLILPIPSFPSSNLLVQTVRSYFVTRG